MKFIEKLRKKSKCGALKATLEENAQKLFQREHYNLNEHYAKYGVHDIYFVPFKPNSESALQYNLVGRREELIIFFEDKSYFNFKFDTRESYIPAIHFREPSNEQKTKNPYKEVSCGCRGEVNAGVTIRAGRNDLKLDYVNAFIEIDSEQKQELEKYASNDYVVLVQDFYKKLRTLASMYNTSDYYAGEYWRSDLKKEDRLPTYPLMDSRYGFEKCLMYFHCNQKEIETRLEAIIQEHSSIKAAEKPV